MLRTNREEFKVKVIITLEGLEARLLLVGQDWSSAWPNVPT